MFIFLVEDKDDKSKGTKCEMQVENHVCHIGEGDVVPEQVFMKNLLMRYMTW
jgi:hypothetical protein